MGKVSNGQEVEVSFPFKMASNPFKIEAEKRREEIVLLINDLGFFRARRLAKTLGEKYKVSERMIYVDFDWIKGHVKPIDLREIRIDLRIARDRALSESLNLLTMADGPKDKIMAISAVIAASKHYREDLEAWGEKPKVEDKLHISGEEETIINLIETPMEVIKNEKERAKSENKPEADGNPESP